MGNPAEIQAKNRSTLIMVTCDGIGTCEQELRHKLLRLYLTMLRENGLIPGAICFYSDGVKMVTEGSPVLDLLRELEAKGTHLIVCSTCLQYFGLTDKVAVGIIGGMNDIVVAQWAADRVITP